MNRKTGGYKEIAKRNYVELKTAHLSGGAGRKNKTLNLEITAAESYLERIEKLESPAKESMFVQCALAGVFTLDRAA